MLEFLTTNGIMTAILLAAVFFLGLAAGRIFQKLKDKAMISQHRKDAVKKSRAVIGGQVAEQLAPYFPGFPCNPGDACFLGKPVDFIAFSGLTEKNQIQEVVFIEVKTGQSKLNAHEKQLKDAIQKGKVSYVEYSPSF